MESELFCQNEVQLNHRWSIVLDPQHSHQEGFNKEGNHTQDQDWKRHGLVFQVYQYRDRDGDGSHNPLEAGTNVKHVTANNNATDTASANANANAITYLVAFRHQEGNTWRDSDQWEAMGLWGRNVVQLLLWSWSGSGSGRIQAPPNSFVSFLAELAQHSIWWTRRYYLQRDYVTLGSRALAAFDIEMSFLSSASAQGEQTTDPTDTTNTVFATDDAEPEPKPHVLFEFTGYSMGGALAQIHAIRYGAPAIVFAANGVLDIMHSYDINYSIIPDDDDEPSKIHHGRVRRPLPNITNIFEASDMIPRMDCQPRQSRVCTFHEQQQASSSSSDDDEREESKNAVLHDVVSRPYHENVHKNLIFGNGVVQHIFRANTNTNTTTTTTTSSVSALLHCRSGNEWNVQDNAVCLVYSRDRSYISTRVGWQVTWSIVMVTMLASTCFAMCWCWCGVARFCWRTTKRQKEQCHEKTE
jgi:hypothetical protein